MKTLPISVMSFKGHYEEYKNPNDVVLSKSWHKNSSIEETYGSFHSNYRGKVYFADPMEPITDSIREAADMIVYDNEPSYPDVNKEVSRNYFGTERKNYRKDFEEIRDYYYRREMGGFADINEAKYQQWQAAECIRIYDKAGDLIRKKEAAENRIKELRDAITHEQSLRPKYKDALKEAEAKAAQHSQRKYFISQKLEKYQLLEDIVAKEVCCPEEEKELLEKEQRFIGDIKEAHKSLYTKLEKELKEEIKTAQGLSENLEGYAERINSYRRSIAECQAIIAGIKIKIVPLFDELKNFYAKQGIKIIK